MDNLIILLIFVQAILTFAGYFYFAREIRDLRRKMEKYTTIAFIVPIFIGAIILGSKFPYMQLEQVINFIYFAIGSVITNTLEGIGIYQYERTLLKSRRYY